MSTEHDGVDLSALKRWREPAAWVALVATILHLPVAVFSLVTYGDPEVFGSFRAAAGFLAPGTASTPLVIVLTTLVGLCVVIEPTRRSGLLAGLAAVAVVLTTLLALAYGIFGVLSPSDTRVPDLLNLLVELVVPVLAAVTLIRLVQARPRAHGAMGESHLRDASARSGPPALGPTVNGPPHQGSVPQEHQPTWQPDAAAGYAWPTAGQAASGAPAAGWGIPGQAPGWQPAESWSGGGSWTPPGFVHPAQGSPPGTAKGPSSASPEAQLHPWATPPGAGATPLPESEVGTQLVRPPQPDHDPGR